jgi:phenylalanyl-tRNA synthetase beta chain
VLDRGVEAAKVIRAAESADKKLITQVSVFDLFESDSLGPAKKSLAIEVTLQPADKTLTDEEIDGVSKKVVAEVVKATGGTLRA